MTPEDELARVRSLIEAGRFRDPGPLPASSYRAYIQSREWATRRRLAIARARCRCQVCNSPDWLEVHHRTYERLGCEDPEDLTVLCRDCHGLFHEVKRAA
jgi:5-methylcytosine-specific restriction endonuclease McrA